jgi:hypothetical protein
MFENLMLFFAASSLGWSLINVARGNRLGGLFVLSTDRAARLSSTQAPEFIGSSR